MAIEAPVNGVSTTLASAISSTSATTCSLTSATGFTNAQYHCLIVDPTKTNFELVEATGLSGTTLTIVRAAESWNGSSTAYTFAVGSTITVVTSLASVMALIAQGPQSVAITAVANAATVPVGTGNAVVTNNSAAALTITLSTSGALDKQQMALSILDYSSAAQTLTFVNTENSNVSVPSVTNGSTTIPLIIGFMYNALTSKWTCVGAPLASPTFSGPVTAPVVIVTADQITATSNAATIPVTNGNVEVTNSSSATLTLTLATSGAVRGQTLILSIYDYAGTAETLTFVNTENSGVSVPTSTNGSTTLPITIGFRFNGATSKWRCVGVV